MRDGAGTDSTGSAPARGTGTPQDTGPGTDGEAAPEGAAPSPGTGEGGSGSDGGAPVDDMGAFEEQMGDSELANALERVAAVEEQLARANADLYNLNQEYAGYVRRSKEAAPAHRTAGQDEVIESLIGVLDDIDAARNHGDLDDGPFAAIAVKLEDSLRNRFELERYGAAGEDFDPALHEALMATVDADVDHPVIGQVLQPGYRRGERVIRAAKVLVKNPE
ncbi:nucleotide exchange factor GrpE [Schaalia georgiae]|nr:nucleotide exchange factor GrpE [Schaalia georgiae]